VCRGRFDHFFHPFSDFRLNSVQPGRSGNTAPVPDHSLLYEPREGSEQIVNARDGVVLRAGAVAA
jgi:hypothetical protein